MEDLELSRESIIWDEHTRAYIESVIKDASEEASKLVNKELRETDFFEWLKKANEVISGISSSGYYGRKSALNILSNLITKRDVSPTFGKTKIRFKPNPSFMFPGIVIKAVKRSSGTWNSKINSYDTKITRDEINSWGGFSPDRMYIVPETSRHSKVKDEYLCELHGGPFYTISKLSDEDLLEGLRSANNKKTSKQVENLFNSAKELRDLGWEQLTTHDTFKPIDYSTVEVPKDFEEKYEEKEAKATLTPAQIREKQGKIVSYSFAKDNTKFYERYFKQVKREPKVEDLDNAQSDVIYGVQSDDEKLKFLADLHFPLKRINSYFEVESIKQEFDELSLLRFSKRNLKYIKNNPKFIHVDKYLHNHNKDEASFNIGDPFISLFTAKHIKEGLKRYQFLRNFADFNPHITLAYKTLERYVSENYDRYNTLAFSTGYGEKFMADAQKAETFQLFLRKNPNAPEEEIKAKSTECFGVDFYRKSKCLDESVLDVFDEIKEYSESLAPLLNHVDYLLSPHKHIPDIAVSLIQTILESTGLDKHQLTTNTTETITNLNSTE